VQRPGLLRLRVRRLPGEAALLAAQRELPQGLPEVAPGPVLLRRLALIVIVLSKACFER